MIVRTQALALEAALQKAEPKRLRYRNADPAGMPTLIGNSPQIARFASIKVGMIASEIFEERKQPVGWPVASGTAVGWGGAVKRALLDCDIGVEIDVRGSFLLVA